MAVMPIRWFHASPLLLSLLMGGCYHQNFDPSKANKPYPFELHTTNTVPIQVFRDGTSMEIVNSTDRHWKDSTIWLNQQFSHSLPSLQPGERVVLDLKAFRNDIGQEFNAGGFFRLRQPSEMALVEIQPGEGQPLVGLIAIGGSVRE
tara:strand:+ start:96 stop:536 length:441 start_codon:yes stop_codon:yes gene_type:complete